MSVTTPIVEDIAAYFREPLERMRATLREETAAGKESCAPEVADRTRKLVAVDSGGRAVAMVLCSPERFPEVIARSVRRASEARQCLGESLGSVVLQPIAAGELCGVSIAMMPWCRGFSQQLGSRAVHRACLVPQVVSWMCQVSSRFAGSTVPPEECIKCLQFYEMTASMPRSIQEDAGVAIRRIELGLWKPKRMLDHNDFWIGNLLRASTRATGQPRGRRFVVIDWGGSNTHGFGFYDYVRLCRCRNVGHSAMTQGIVRLCESMGIELQDSMGQMLASLGWLGSNRDQFPIDRYVNVVRCCWDSMRRVAGVNRSA